MPSQLNPVSPVHGRGLPQRTVASGEVLRVDVQNNVAIGATVLMPTVYDDDTIVIVRAAGDAGASAITINGNGQTIDGASSTLLNWNRGVVVFGRDAEIGEWCRLLVPRQLDGSIALLMKARDAQGVVGGGASPERIQDPSLIGQSSNAQWTAGNFTTAVQFVTHRALSMLGADVWVKMAAARNIMVTLYDPVAAVLAQKTFNNVAALAGRVRFLFDAAVALPSNVALGTGYRICVRDTSGTEACGSPGVQGITTAEIAGLRTHVIRPDVYSNNGFFVAGAGYPATSGGTTHYPICPAFADDSPANVPATSLS